MVVIAAVTGCAVAQDAPPKDQIGLPVKDVLGPKEFAKVKQEIAGHQLPTVGNLDAATSALRRDLADLKRQNAEILKQNAVIHSALAEKDMSRVAVLEQRLGAIEDLHRSEAARDKAWADRFWGMGITLATSGVLTGLGMWRGYVKGRQHTAAVANAVATVSHTVATVSTKVAAIEEHTDGMLTKLMTLTGDKAFSEGHDAGVAEEQAAASESVRGKLGRDV
jgi:uncharacterized protein YoxC